MRAIRVLALPLLVALLLPACASTGRLGEYDFRGRTLALVLLAPPRPDVFTEDDSELWQGDLANTLLAVGTGIVREREAARLRERLDEAVERVDVSVLMGDRTLERAARALRMEPVDRVQDADFEIEVEVRAYGIEADSWDAQANFFVDGRVRLIDAATGAEVWKADVTEYDAVNREYLGLPGPVGDVVTAAVLARLEVDEIERALEGLAAYAADRMTDELRRAWEKSRD